LPRAENNDSQRLPASERLADGNARGFLFGDEFPIVLKVVQFHRHFGHGLPSRARIRPRIDSTRLHAKDLYLPS
jgi:hypothetical protein